MNIQSDWLSIYIAVMGIVISALLAYLSYSLNRQSQRASTARSIEDLYDKIVKYRAEHPEVMKLCHLWNNDCFDAIYRQDGPAEIQWVIYYNYVELISGFVNTVLYGQKNRLLEKRAYEGYYKPLVKMLLTEHYPYFASILEAPYLSSYIKEFIDALKGTGLDFNEKHKKMIGSAAQAEIKTAGKMRKRKP